MQIRPLVLALLALLLAAAGHSQNFIPNWSFENYALCPQSRNDGRRSFSWDTPTQGTSDYFNSCATPQSNLDVPANFAGTQSPRTGSAYAGFYASQNFNFPFLEYREYMQVTLDSFLVAGGIYSFEMYVSLGDNSNFASNKIGAYISVDKINANTLEYLDYKPQVLSSGYITDKTGWTKISGTYIAKGGEHYITIGVFEPAATHTRIAVPGGNQFDPNYEGVSYYYLDDVSMTRACDLPKELLRQDTSICADQFTPFSINAFINPAAVYLWNTGNNATSINIDSPGTYILNAKTPYCSVYDTLKVTFNKKPVVSLGPDTTLCNSTLQLKPSGTKGLSYLWSTTSTDSMIRVTQSGTYAVRIGLATCSASDTIKVTIVNIKPFDLGNDTVVCTGSMAILKVMNNPGANFRWSTFETTPAIAVSAPGRYWAEAYSGTCSVRDSIQITFLQTPAINLGNDTALCFNQPYIINASPAANYLWNNGSVNSSITATQAGLYWVEVRNQQCRARDSMMILQKQLPSVNLGSNRTVCKETQVTLNAGSDAGTTWLWNTGAATNTITVSAPGTFCVHAVNSEGCYTNDTIVLDTFASPVVNLGNDSFMCEGRTYTIDAGVFTTYLWNDGSVQQTFVPQTAGTYAVTVTDANACKASDTVSLRYYSKPDLFLLKELRVCEPDTLITAVSSTNNFKWNDSSSLATQHITTYGTFTVTVTDTNSCTNTASLEVIGTCPGTIYVPNVFTPANEDGLNETFFPVVRNVKWVHMQIYTRWGELVYETEDMNKGWNGTYHNQPAQEDVYVYKIDYTGLNGFTRTYAGNVTLLK
jgi:gliding motility-associated-like protein